MKLNLRMDKIVSMITGSENNFQLPDRIFNAAIFLSLLLCVQSVLTNYFVNLPFELVAISLVSMLFYIIVYWFSRFRNPPLKFIWPVAIYLPIFVSYVWIHNGGSTGATHPFLPLIPLCFLPFFAAKGRTILTICYCTVSGLLLTFEYLYPDQIGGYPSADSRFYDILISTICTQIVMVFIVSLYISENHGLAQKFDAMRKKSEQRFGDMADSVPAIICEVALDSTIEYINREGIEFSGYRQEEVYSSGFLKKVIHSQDWDRFIYNLNNIMSGGTNVASEYRLIMSDGSERIVFGRSVPRYNKGSIDGYRAYLLDITEQKQLEMRYLAAQKMEAIGTLAGGIAHDFNNILSGILGYTHLAEITLHDIDKAKKNIKLVGESAQRAAELVSQILTISRKSQYSKKPLPLYVIVKEVLRLIHSTIPSNIEIREVLNTEAKIMADATQIYQVIMNLCTNASHAMGDGGGILIVRLDEIEITENEIRQGLSLFPGKYLKLEITDTGPGIDPEIKEKIFDPYFTTKKIGKGTGLGLAVVDSIIKKHNGFIELKTILGAGTTFQTYLPAFDKQSLPDDSEKKEEGQSTGTERIMLVDDETAILGSLKAILNRWGYVVSTFENGESALQEFKENPDQFDLIITDMTMPRMTGDKLSREALKIRTQIPIIICTGYHESFTKEDAYKAGIKKYVQKPVTGLGLLKIIREVLDRK